MNAMTLVTCPDCGARVSVRAKFCPGCRCPAKFITGELSGAVAPTPSHTSVYRCSTTFTKWVVVVIGGPLLLFIVSFVLAERLATAVYPRVPFDATIDVFEAAERDHEHFVRGGRVALITVIVGAALSVAAGIWLRRNIQHITWLEVGAGVGVLFILFGILAGLGRQSAGPEAAPGFGTAARLIAEIAFDPTSANAPADAAEAVAWYQSRAERGDPSAMHDLGMAYLNGRGVPKDEAEAVRWFRKAAEAGNPVGMRSLAFMYSAGRGVPQSDRHAFEWYGKAAKAGDAIAMNNLGFSYDSGQGVKEDEAEAVRWFRGAAEAGNPMGMSNLGVKYETGEGVGRDMDLAIMWYRRAAKAGSAVAMRHLGRIYERGIGVPVDPDEASRWYAAAEDANLD